VRGAFLQDLHDTDIDLEAPDQVNGQDNQAGRPQEPPGDDRLPPRA
jgi:hypothetical protein